MWWESIKFKPVIDGPGLNKMISTLKKKLYGAGSALGGGLKKTFGAGGILAGGFALVDKLLNPLKETQELVQNTLTTSAGIVTSSKQFETTADRYFKLLKLAEAKGLEQQGLDQMLGKFQLALAQARADMVDPTKSVAEREANPLKNFLGETDVAEAFFKFIQNLQKLTKDQQLLVQQNIFGEKAIGRAAEFIQETDFAGLSKRLGLDRIERFEQPLGRLDELADRRDEQAVARSIEDLFNKGRLINRSTVDSIDQGARQDLAIENRNLSQFETLKQANIALNDLKKTATDQLIVLQKAIPTVVEGIGKVTETLDKAIEGIAGLTEKVMNSPLFRLIGGGR